MDHNTVFSHNYVKQKRRRQKTNAPPSWAISMAMQTHWCNTGGIAQCSMFRATPEATGCCHRATTCSVLPQWLPGQQQIKQQQKHTPVLLAILMAMAMHQYDTRTHRPIEEVQGSTISHWTPALGNDCGQ